MPLRLGYVKYLNTLPLVEGLDTLKEAQMIAAVPAKLGPMLAAGSVEIALASLIDFARSSVPLTLLPCGMIGCDGKTLTVRLYSTVPPSAIKAVHADTDSHTSVALLRVILARQYAVTPSIIDFDARGRTAISGAGAQTVDRDGWPESVLLIGDKVATDAPPEGRYAYELDLGEAWKTLTGMPFVYAVWMCRREDADRQDVRAMVQLLDRQRRRNTVRLDWLVARCAAERRWPEALARDYVGSLLRYEVTPEARQAAARFLAECAELGIAPALAPVWLSESTATAGV